MRTLALLAVATFACKASSPSTPPRATTIDERQACSADADCAVVELTCCDACNGGTVAGVHRDFAADVHREYTSACAGATCTERGCVDQPAPACDRGMCVVRTGDQVVAEPLPAR
ncbi:MAG: hypothetical protein IPL61_40700 [Myxococcales bacterium]|nr:hypothetical protein [Myxococcales bacterium]